MKDFREIVQQPRTVALYANLTSDSTIILQVRYTNLDEHWQVLPQGEQREVAVEGYVRISQPLELTFQPAEDKAVIANAIASLDEEERKARHDLHEKLINIRERRNQLLALTHEVQS